MRPIRPPLNASNDIFGHCGISARVYEEEEEDEESDLKERAKEQNRQCACESMFVELS